MLFSIHKIMFKDLANRTVFNKCNNKIMNNICELGADRAFILTDGSIFPCERVKQFDYFEIGNVLEGFYKSKIDMFHSLELIQRFMDTIGNICCECWAHRFCSFMTCLKYAAVKEGFSKKYFIENCEVSKNYINMIFQTFMFYEDKYPEVFHTVLNSNRSVPAL